MTSEIQTGVVKWFNNKRGYGFITMNDSDEDNSIFVHHTGIHVSEQQYKYLVEGESVSFVVSDVTEGEHKQHATDVRGPDRGLLTCEKRKTNPEQNRSTSTLRGGRGRGRGRGRGGGRGRGRGRGNSTSERAKIVKNTDGDDWTIVPVKH